MCPNLLHDTSLNRNQISFWKPTWRAFQIAQMFDQCLQAWTMRGYQAHKTFVFRVRGREFGKMLTTLPFLGQISCSFFSSCSPWRDTDEYGKKSMMRGAGIEPSLHLCTKPSRFRGQKWSHISNCSRKNPAVRYTFLYIFRTHFSGGITYLSFSPYDRPVFSGHIRLFPELGSRPVSKLRSPLTSAPFSDAEQKKVCRKRPKIDETATD